MDKKERKILACPICGGPLTSWIGFKGGLIYSCKKCGYRGPLNVRMSKEDSEKLRKRYDAKRKIN
jgi:ssDNA-binding Zn-finger/Zn-ribbon topoisomerase 1